MNAFSLLDIESHSNLQMTQNTCLSHSTLQNIVFNSGPEIGEHIENKSEICEGQF